MKVEVTRDWGLHKKGDIIELEDSTAKACIAHKVVKKVVKKATRK